MKMNGTPNGWICPKCSRVYSPWHSDCGPCNAPIDHNPDRTIRWAIRFDFPHEEQELFAGMYHGQIGWTYELQSALVYESSEVAEKTLECGFGPEARRHGRVVGVRELPRSTR